MDIHPRASRDAGSVHPGRCLNILPPRQSRSAYAERALIATCLVLAALLAWCWLWRQQQAPGMTDMDMTGMAAPQPSLGATFLMWALMMVAMMLPSALPMILLHARLMTTAATTTPRRLSVTAVFALGYLLVWTATSFIAALAQQQLTASGLITGDGLMFGNPLIAGGLLMLAGFYQFSPLKRFCLERCRSPLSFLMRGWRPDIGGALRLGLRHGLYCLGCCWLLMALLFVGGVMNLGWIAVLAFIVFAEKILPAGRITALVIGILAIFAGWVLIAHGLGFIGNIALRG